MGVDTNIHIGPYMIVKGKKVGIIEHEVNTCSNKKCDTYKLNKPYVDNQKFCAECASVLAVKKYKEKYTIYPDTLLDEEPYCDEFVDELCWTDPMGCSRNEGVFIANHRSPFDKKRDANIIDLTNVNTDEEIAWFKKKYKEIIDIFEKEFGEKSVKINWGVINWYS